MSSSCAAAEALSCGCGGCCCDGCTHHVLAHVDPSACWQLGHRTHMSIGPDDCFSAQNWWDRKIRDTPPYNTVLAITVLAHSLTIARQGTFAKASQTAQP